jgi:desulfoferrodoxin (superoxide reductase-like protein)
LGEKAALRHNRRFDVCTIGYLDKGGKDMPHYHKISRRSFIKKMGAVGLFAAIGSFPTEARANVPTVSLDTTDLGDKNFEVTVKVFHKGNNLFHYVDRVTLFADGEEIKAWDYSWNKRPESENFSVQTRVRVTRKTLYSAVANCNLHGENKDKGVLQLSP